MNIVLPGLNTGDDDDASKIHKEALNLLGLIKEGKQLVRMVSHDDDGDTVFSGTSSRISQSTATVNGDIDASDDKPSLLEILGCNIRCLQRLNFSIRLALNETRNQVRVV